MMRPNTLRTRLWLGVLDALLETAPDRPGRPGRCRRVRDVGCSGCRAGRIRRFRGGNDAVGDLPLDRVQVRQGRCGSHAQARS